MRQSLGAVETKCYKGNMNLVALHLPLLEYPRQALRKGIGGRVTIKVFVDESGNVYHALAVDGPGLLKRAALRSAREAAFAPFTQDAKPVRCAGLLVYTFKPPNQ